MKNGAFTLRLRILSAVFILSMGLIGLKLFFVQVIESDKYVARAETQYKTPTGSIFERGSILLTNKDGSEVSGATQLSGFKLAIVPKQIIDPEKTFAALAPYITMPRDEFIKKASKKSDPYEEITTRLSKETADTIRGLKLDGVSLFREKWRFYPGGVMAARTLGFVAYKGDLLTGRYGLERSYNDVLSRDADGLYVNFFAELFNHLRSAVFEERRAGDIVTTIEPNVQSQLEETLRGLQSSWHSDLIGGIVIDPNNGEIKAMGVLPDFDVNAYNEVRDPGMYGNPLVEGAYELGSTIKTLTMAAGIDAGVITPETTYNDKGFVTFNTETLNNFDKKGRGVINMQTVLNQSLNTGSAFVFTKLGREKFRNYMLSFGLSEKTGIDLPGEIKSLTNNLNSPRDVEYATASFGQGIALTPIAAVRAFSSIANGGTLIQPHLVRAIHYEDGGTKTLEFPEGQRILKPETTTTIARMMTGVMDNGLGEGKYKLPHHSVAVKTGTAQVAFADGHGYEPGKFLHSLYGFFPSYDPQFLVFLFQTNPQGAEFSSQTLVYPFVDMTKFLISYYQIPPDR
jgi:stage V sporulation protein D (sporulation-specific penicillin-binding protein)